MRAAAKAPLLTGDYMLCMGCETLLLHMIYLRLGNHDLEPEHVKGGRRQQFKESKFLKNKDFGANSELR